MTRTEKLREIEREIALRRNVYRARVAAGKRRQRDADYHLGVMTAIAEDYRRPPVTLAQAIKAIDETIGIATEGVVVAVQPDGTTTDPKIAITGLAHAAEAVMRLFNPAETSNADRDGA
jgi:hypothetical protein